MESLTLISAGFLLNEKQLTPPLFNTATLSFYFLIPFAFSETNFPRPLVSDDCPATAGRWWIVDGGWWIWCWELRADYYLGWEPRKVTFCP